ncbi:MAG: flagellin [bacterium]|jgi:flagellin
MALRINHNVAAMNAWRNLTNTDANSAKTLEKLASGYKINRAADGPAALVISEQMRAQIGSMEQAIGNSEIAVSMVQTTEAALNEVNGILVAMRQLTIHAANEGVNDTGMLEADQAEIENSLETINRIARQAQFGTRFLLDGSGGISGIAVGDDLKFIEATKGTNASSSEGYEVNVSKQATKAFKDGTRSLTESEVRKGGVKFTLGEGGKSISYTSKPNDSMEMIRNNLQKDATVNQLNVNLTLTQDGKFRIEHTEFGSNQEFTVAAGVEGLFGGPSHTIEKSNPGSDVQGTINGEVANGTGQFLEAASGTQAEGLEIQYTGKLVEKEGIIDEFGKSMTLDKLEKGDNAFEVVSSTKTVTDESGQTQEVKTRVVRDKDGKEYPVQMVDAEEGFIHISNNALLFQVGPNGGQTARIALPNVHSSQLSKGIENESGFEALEQIDVRSFNQAQDSLNMIDDAINMITSVRGDLGAFQKNTLESNLTNLRYATENLVAAESSIRDTDMASEMSEFTKNQILMSSGTAMLSQANQAPKAVLSLLNAN